MAGFDLGGGGGQDLARTVNGDGGGVLDGRDRRTTRGFAACWQECWSAWRACGGSRWGTRGSWVKRGTSGSWSRGTSSGARTRVLAGRVPVAGGVRQHFVINASRTVAPRAPRAPRTSRASRPASRARLVWGSGRAARIARRLNVDPRGSPCRLPGVGFERIRSAIQPGREELLAPAPVTPGRPMTTVSTTLREPPTRGDSTYTVGRPITLSRERKFPLMSAQATKNTGQARSRPEKVHRIE